MSVAKVLGIETEYGIAGGPDADQIVASSIIVNAKRVGPESIGTSKARRPTWTRAACPT